jgi:hyperosmotically inducible protein
MNLQSKKLAYLAVVTCLAVAALAPVAARGQGAKKTNDERRAAAQARLYKEVRHELVTLSYYSVFDNLAYKVEDDKVTLVGQVTTPTLKSDAEKAVKRIEGVAKVDNQIEVLPLSPNDDRIRREEFRAIYSAPGMEKYAIQAVPPIHIIVKNGHVTLVGVVANQMDKNLTNVRANSVSGVFSVSNELAVEK